MFAVVILVFATSTGRVTTLLHLAPFQKLGLWSYSIYMTHLFILGVIHTVGRILGPRLGRTDIGAWWASVAHLPGMADGQVVAYALLVIAVSSQTYRFIEVPGQTLLNRVARKAEPA